MKPVMNFTLRVYKRGREVDRYETSSKRRFYNHVGTIKWNIAMILVKLRVSYGEGFVNEGDYRNKKDFMLALNAFSEK